MASYDATKMLFKSGKYSDLVVSCNGTTFPVHCAVVCTQSLFFEAATNFGLAETRTGIIDLPEDDPTAVEKFLSILYCGNYPDVIFGNNQEPHVTAQYNTRQIQERLSKGCTLMQGRDTPSDKSDDTAIGRFYRSKTWSVNQDSTQLIVSITDALWIYFLGLKYQVPIVRLVTVYRINLCLEILVDVVDLDNRTIIALTELIDELYTNTCTDADSHCTIRYAFCSALHQAVRNPVLEPKFKLACKELFKIHPDFKRDIARGI